MSNITLRQIKGSELSIAEIDANFENLNFDKIERILEVNDADYALSITQNNAVGSGLRLVKNGAGGNVFEARTPTQREVFIGDSGRVNFKLSATDSTSDMGVRWLQNDITTISEIIAGATSVTDGNSVVNPYLAFANGGSERMRINNGNLLLGTTTDGGQRLQVNGSSLFTGGVYNSSGYYTTSNASLAMYEMHMPNVTASALYLATNGDVRIATTGGGGNVLNNNLTVSITGDVTARNNFIAATTTGGFTAQDTTAAAFFTTITQSLSTYAPALKIRTTGATKTRTISFGSLHNTDNTIDAVIHAINNGDGESTSWRFANNGDFISPGNVTAYSDERLKEDWRETPSLVEGLAHVKSGTYTMKSNGERQVGVSAQSLQTVLPEAVKDNNGTLSVAYGNAALAACVELSKRVMQLEKELKELKESKDAG